MKVQSARGLSDSDLIEEINRVALQLDTKILSKSDFNNNSQFSATVICRRFGNWSNGLQLAGLKPKHQTYSELEYFENLLNVWTQYGRQPKHKEMDLSPSLISSGAYESKWGKWSSALQAFIEFVKKEKIEEGSKDEEKERPFIKIEENKIDKVETRSISVGLRYKILNRDRFRCVKCGRSPASDLTCEIHIDHILPFSKGGRTIFENLQTTCKECNLGKSNNYVH